MARILIVEDDEMDRVLLSTVLAQAGHDPVFAPNGKSALRIWIKAPADVVVTDLAMPELGGLDLIRVLKKGDPWVRIIAISGAKAHQLATAREYGALATLAKPIDAGKLVELVNKLLEQHGHWSDVQR
jgi:CheY-like chemotaxis protein